MGNFKLFLLLTLLTWVHGRPNGSPVCTTGQSAPAGPHLPPVLEGTIDQGGIAFSIGGRDLSTESAFEIETGVLYEVVISTDTFFRGVLAIIDGGDSAIDTTDAFTLADGESDLQISSICLTSGVRFHLYQPNTNPR